ncbi:MAG TPA: DUF5103 domain-containing protein [Saprospiraceae bacterium]|nr:DUF5103 domain-containing protein [Saprospiraceae bacterium]
MLLTILVAGLSLVLNAQDKFQYQDKVYVDNIRTVQFHVTGLLTSYPIMQLGSEEALYLSFDDLDADSKYYRYSVIHCDRNWQPSQLDFTEYVNGFEGEEIETFDRSINTLVPFTHYSLVLPNADCEITKSGNYLLVIYIEDPASPVITRRFMLVDSRVAIHASLQRPANVSRITTHQEIDFEVSAEYLRVLDVKNDIYAVVLQNGRWDNAIQGIRSKFERGHYLVFDYQDKIVFPAGLDFRNMDIRSTQYRSRDVFEIRRENNRIRIVAEIDEPRSTKRYLSDLDINGSFVIRSSEDRKYGSVKESQEHSKLYDNANLNLSQKEIDELKASTIIDITEYDLLSDYVDVLFTLKTDAPYDSDVFLLGAFTDWKLDEKFRMTYKREYGAYFADIPMKQGFYDYIYVLANSDGTPDETTIEGHWYEASNDYTILIYHTPFGARYDQLVGAVTMPSAR